MLNVLVVVGALSGVAGWLLSEVLRDGLRGRSRERARFTSPPRRDIRDVADGELVRIVGRVEIATPLEAPLTGRACALWRVVVRDNKWSGIPSFIQFAEDQRGVEFVVDDGTGRALITVSNVFVVLSRGHSESVASFVVRPKLAAFFHDRDIVVPKYSPIAYAEGIVGPGDTIAVIGVASHEPDSGESGGGYRDASTRVVMRAPTNGKLLISDERFLVS